MCRLFCAETASVVRSWLKANIVTFFEFILGGVFLATLTACGGGGGGSAPAAPAASTSTVSGQVVDSPFPNAKVVILSGNLSGPILGTATADINGKYSITFPTPTGTTPIFITATNSAGTTTLASYVGSANQLTGTLTDANIPNLNITQVTTSALALMQNNGLSLATLTPAQYGQQITQLNNLIIQLAGIVQDLVDQPDAGCGFQGGGTVNLSSLSGMLGSSTILATSNLYTLVAPKLAASCTITTMANLSSGVAGEVAGSGIMGGQLTATAATAGTGLGIPVGSYTGTVIPIITSVTPATCSTNSTGYSSSVVVTVVVGSTGGITLSSVTGPVNLTGSLTGTNFTMTGTDPNPLSVTGAFTLLPSSSVSGGSGFSVNGSWTDSYGGCAYAGTYNAQNLLSSGASLTGTPTSIPNTAYNVTIQPIMLACSNCAITTIPSFPATITINNGVIAFTGVTSGGTLTGSGTITGNTFTMSLGNSNCGGGNLFVTTGTMSLSSSGGLILNGSYGAPTTSTCQGQSGTFTGA